MDAKTWQIAKGWLADLAELPVSEREAYLTRHCPDAALRQELLAMLADPASLSGIVAGVALEPGARLGPYEIVDVIGAGGMGEVYRARDVKLNRTIAVKVLPHTSASDPERRSRFEREAQSIAALNHPNIVTIHSVEEADGVLFLTMEHIEGKPLSDLIVPGGLPLQQILNLAIPLADAVSAAHRHGITHRDLKPTNVMVTTDGRVKVLDFGLAKLVDPSAMSPFVSALPTDVLTGEGRIVGTVAYMSPEQAEGRAVDPRSDIFSLGILLYEMATGVRPFTGETTLSVLSAIVRDTPRSVTEVNPTVPREFARVVKRCLAKEVARRYQTAVDLRNELEELRTELDSGAISSPASPQTQSCSGSVMGVPATSSTIRATLTKPATIASIGIAALVVGVFAVLAFRPDLWHRGVAPPSPPTHRQVTFVGNAAYPAISRDGKFLAYVTDTPGTQHQVLYVQDLSGGQPLQIFEGEGLGPPAWSNGGSELLIDNNQLSSSGLFLVPRLGGPARRVMGLAFRQSWSPDDGRFAAIVQTLKQIFLVDKITGAVTTIHLMGSFVFLVGVDWSPAGNLLLFQTRDEQERDAIWTIRVDGSRQEKLVESDAYIFSPRWSLTGDAIYYLRGEETKELLALPVSPLTGKASGSPRAVLAGLQAGGWFTISENRHELAYTREVGHANLWLASIKRSSASARDVDVKQLTSGTASDGYPSISPDGRQVAFSRSDGSRANVFVMPLEGGSPQQITFLNSRNLFPVWSPDGATLAFGSTEDGQQRVWQVSPTGGTPRALEHTRLSTNSFQLAWAPGRGILYQDPGNRNFQQLNPRTGEQTPLVADSSVGWMFGATMSPDNTNVAVRWNRRDALSGVWLIPSQKSSDATLLATRSGKVFGTISQAVDASTLRGRDVALVAHVEAEVSGSGNQGQCWLRVERHNGKPGFFENMQDRPMQSPRWTEVTINGKVDGDAERLVFGCFLAGTGQLSIDDIHLQVKHPTGQWVEVPIKNPGFEESDDRVNPTGWRATGPGYVFHITDASPYKGRRCLSIKSTYVVGDFWPLEWSTDGKYIYAINQRRRTQIVMIRADGGEMHSLIDVPVRGGLPIVGVAITPDGQRVVYSEHQGQSDVWIARNFDSAR